MSKKIGIILNNVDKVNIDKIKEQIKCIINNPLYTVDKIIYLNVNNDIKNYIILYAENILTNIVNLNLIKGISTDATKKNKNELNEKIFQTVEESDSVYVLTAYYDNDLENIMSKIDKPYTIYKFSKILDTFQIVETNVGEKLVSMVNTSIG